MATAAQLAACRSNCLRSTGPRTASGKARSCRNSLKHGLRSKSALLPDEDPEPFRRLFAALQAEHLPSTPEAEQAVLSLAVSMWKLRRADRVEKEIWLSFDLKTAIARVAILRRYRSTIERALFQAADFLLALTPGISKRSETSPTPSPQPPKPPPPPAT